MIALGLLSLFVVTAFSYVSHDNEAVKLYVRSDKTSYKLGEIVKLSLELKNEGEDDAVIRQVFTVSDGSLKILVSNDGKTFPEYNPGWGSIDFANGSKVLKPNESLGTNASILWHNKPNALAGQSKEFISKIAEKTVLTDYAFPSPGTYFIKAVFDENLESKAIRIDVTEPVGDDSEVWNEIKTNENLGFFLQMGHFPGSVKPDVQKLLISKVEKILSDYPDSLYSDALRQSLIRFRELETKRFKMKSQ